MMDMGGVPTSKTTTRINTSQNCHVQAVAFDFSVLTKSLTEHKPQPQQPQATAPDSTNSNSTTLGQVTPNADMVQQVADLLRVNLGETTTNRTNTPQADDDLSLLLGKSASASSSTKTSSSKNISQSSALPKKQNTTNPLFANDVRAKYADKLQKKQQQGTTLSSVELAKQQLDLNKGDAASHWAARNMAKSLPSSNKKWMASTGTGALLQYLTQRSLKLALLPTPHTTSNITNEEEATRMQDFQKQLSDVVVDVVITDGSLGASHVLQTVLLPRCTPLAPESILVVSDRDEYLRHAKDCGMVTCRIRPPNAPRGNVSAHYTAPSIPEVQNVLDEINGISFNAVLKGRGMM